MVTSFYQKSANHVSFCPLLNLRNLLYLIQKACPFGTTQTRKSWCLRTKWMPCPESAFTIEPQRNCLMRSLTWFIVAINRSSILAECSICYCNFHALRFFLLTYNYFRGWAMYCGEAAWLIWSLRGIPSSAAHAFALRLNGKTVRFCLFCGFCVLCYDTFCSIIPNVHKYPKNQCLFI